ncbi:MAG: sugar phosphate nucleotidyltransferase [Chloroflexia bacterium]
MKAVVMAGGEGSRLRPLTLRRPKPMVPVVDKPVMAHILDLLKLHGIDEVIVTLQYMAENIQEFFGDGSALDMKIRYSIEETPLGTAGSVKQAEEWLDDTFLLISGDALTDFDLTKAIEFHKEKAAMATLVLKRMPNPLEYGVVILDDEGRVQKFQEKPSWGEVFSDTVNTGIYVLDPKVLSYFEVRKVFDFSTNLFPMLLKKRDPMFGYIADGYWCDIGSIPDYMRSTADLLEGQVNVPRSGRQVSPGIWAEDDVEIDPSAHLTGPIYLSSGVKVKAGATIRGPAVIRDYTIVDGKAIVDRSVIWRNCYIGERAEVRGAILCRQVSVKSRALVFEGAVIGDGTIVGEGAIIQPSVKVWPEKEIEAGATLATSLIWGSQGRRNLFGRFGVTGVVNVDLTPEFTAKLGAAYGATLKRGSLVAVNRDAHYITRMLKRAMISGLPSAGIHVADLGSVPIPTARYWTRTFDAAGGIHLRLSAVDARVVDIRFFDDRGLELNKTTERKIETTYFREDFRRMFGDEIGRIFYPNGVTEQYSTDFLNHIDMEIVQKGAPYNRIVVDYAGGSTAAVLPPLLNRLGCDVVAINAAADEANLVQTEQQFQAGMKRLSEITKAVGAGFGVRLDMGGERIYLVDDTGRIVTAMASLAAMVALYASLNPGATVAVPVYAPSSMETITARSDGKLLRTPGTPAALAQAGDQDHVGLTGQGNGSFAFADFHPAPDGMFAIAKLVEMTARLQTKLSDVVNDLPRYAMLRKDVGCRWDDKGKVMRLLNERYRDNNIPQIDGVKIMERDNEWVLILPDADQPTFHIITEARNNDRAAALMEKYSALVGSLQG